MALSKKDASSWKLSSDEKESRFEEGVPADPTQAMSDEDAAEWAKMNKEHGDKFKKDASRWKA